ncbi:MAG: hypothetical protein AAGJ54_09635 [Planctomycetota bacterium]
MSKLLGLCAAGLFASSIAQAQVATETVNLGDLSISGAGDTISVGTGFFHPGEPFVAWRFVSDFSQLNDTSFPVSTGVRVGFRTLVGAPLSSLEVQAINGNSRPGSDVQGLTLAAPFDSDPLASASINFVIDIAGPNDDVGVFADATLELFTASDLPEAPIATGLLDASAPDIDVDLGFVALDGDAVEFAADDQSGTWGDPTLVIYTSDGTPLTFVDDGFVFFEIESFQDLGAEAFVVSPDVADIQADGSVGFRRFGPGEYAVAVMNDLDGQNGPFGAEGDNTIPVDAIVAINDAVAVVPIDAINGDPNRVGWIKFTVGARAADFNSDGVADADDVVDFLSAADAGAADFNDDGSTDVFDLLAFLKTFDAGD